MNCRLTLSLTPVSFLLLLLLLVLFPDLVPICLSLEPDIKVCIAGSYPGVLGVDCDLVQGRRDPANQTQVVGMSLRKEEKNQDYILDLL